MKRKLLTFITLAVAVSAFAQIEIKQSGRIMVGSHQSAPPAQPRNPNFGGGGFEFPDELVMVSLDTLATLNLLGPESNNSGGYITFGDGNNVSVGEYGTSDSNILYLIGEYGLKYKNKNGVIFEIDKNAGSPFNFNCDVRANGVLLSSDARLKTDVEEIEDVTTVLKGITPISYRLSNTEVAAKTTDGSEVKTANSAPNSRLRYGFVAQEVKEVFPSLVHEDANGLMSVDYIGFIPLLVDAVKGLSAKVEEQEEIIAELTAPEMQKTRHNAGVEGPAEVKASLSQNKPNPFSVSTIIECTLPETVATAELRVYDLQGKQLMKFGIEGRGKTSINIDGSTLQPGMYIYALIADGEEIDSKRMILTD